MEEYVDKLALLQAQLNAAEIAIDNDSHVIEYRATVSSLEIQLGNARDALYDLISGHGKDLIEEQIEEAKEQIIDEWTGEKKTMVFGDRVLKFTTRGSLNIHDEAWLLNDILDRMSVEDMIKKKYLKGFNLTAVKQYMSVIDLPIDVAEIEYKTTVKLEQSG